VGEDGKKTGKKKGFIPFLWQYQGALWDDSAILGLHARIVLSNKPQKMGVFVQESMFFGLFFESPEPLS